MANIDINRQRKDLNNILLQLEKALRNVFSTTCRRVLNIAYVRKAIENGEAFTWDGNKLAALSMLSYLKDYSDKASSLIMSAVQTGYTKGENAVVSQVTSVYGNSNKADVQQICTDVIKSHRADGKNARVYSNAVRGGMTISDRVWRDAQAVRNELEVIIQNGILRGASADELSRDVRHLLKDPESIYRRVRNKKTGLLELSEAAKNYHPGSGVYRSSYKNAMRLARTEVNNAYRAAEWESYQDNPLIKGYEIRLSNNHTCMKPNGMVNYQYHDICDELAGEYPKDFMWTGWHPQCRCVMIPITIKSDDLTELMRQRRKARKEGKDVNAVKVGKDITEMPDNFKAWYTENQSRLMRADGGPSWGDSSTVIMAEAAVQGVAPDGGNLREFLTSTEEGKKITNFLSAKNVSSIPKEFNSREQTEWNKYNREVESIFQEMNPSFKRTKQSMSFFEADNYNTNPNYIAGKKNPYNQNCQTCVAVHELRLRGFNIEALGNTNDSVWKYVKDEFDIFRNIDGSHINILIAQRTSQESVKQSIVDYLQPNKRYIMSFCWKKTGERHVVNIQKINNIIHIYDAQSGMNIFDIYKYITQITLNQDIKLARVDNALINKKLIKTHTVCKESPV